MEAITEKLAKFFFNYNPRKDDIKDKDSVAIAENLEASAVETKIEDVDEVFKITNITDLDEVDESWFIVDYIADDCTTTTEETGATSVANETNGHIADDVKAPAVETEATSVATETNGRIADDVSKGANGTVAKIHLTRLERNIIHHIENYFGDSNLPRNRYLLKEIAKDENNWVPLSVILKYYRIAALKISAGVIVETMLKSNNGIVEISEDKLKIRPKRMPPISKNLIGDIEEECCDVARIAVVKKFPEDTKMSELVELFAPYSKITNIRQCTKFGPEIEKDLYKFNGIVHITFKTAGDCRKFMFNEKLYFKTNKLFIYIKKSIPRNIPYTPKNRDILRHRPDSLLFFEGADDTVTGELIKTSVFRRDRQYKVDYVDYYQGNNSGYIYLRKNSLASKFLNRLRDDILRLNGGVELTIRKPTAYEENLFQERNEILFTNLCCRQNLVKNLPCHYNQLDME